MKSITPIEKHHGRYFPWVAGSAACLGLAGTLRAFSEVLENDTDGDGITDCLESADDTDLPRIRKSPFAYVRIRS